MSVNLLNQITSYKNNRRAFTDEERQTLRATMRAEVKAQVPWVPVPLETENQDN